MSSNVESFCAYLSVSVWCCAFYLFYLFQPCIFCWRRLGACSDFVLKLFPTWKGASVRRNPHVHCRSAPVGNFWSHSVLGATYVKPKWDWVKVRLPFLLWFVGLVGKTWTVLFLRQSKERMPNNKVLCMRRSIGTMWWYAVYVRCMV